MEKIGKSEVVEESWDKKKIVTALLFLVLFAGTAYAAKKYFLGSSTDQFLQKFSQQSQGVVAGISTENQNADTTQNKTPTPPFTFSGTNIQNSLQEKFASIKNQVGSLSVDDIASASPQVQKVITDLKALQDYPKTQAKQFCENLCRNF